MSPTAVIRVDVGDPAGDRGYYSIIIPESGPPVRIVVPPNRDDVTIMRGDQEFSIRHTPADQPLVRNVESVDCRIVAMGNLTPFGIEPEAPMTLSAALVIAGFAPGDRCVITWKGGPEE